MKLLSYNTKKTDCSLHSTTAKIQNNVRNNYATVIKNNRKFRDKSENTHYSGI